MNPEQIIHQCGQILANPSHEVGYEEFTAVVRMIADLAKVSGHGTPKPVETAKPVAVPQPAATIQKSSAYDLGKHEVHPGGASENAAREHRKAMDEAAARDAEARRQLAARESQAAATPEEG
jgi:hypothetical protein